MTNKMLVILIVIIVAFLGGVLFLFTKQQASSPLPQKQGMIPQTPSVFQLKETKIEITTSGFSPKIVTIKKDEGIIWINKSGKKATINSADHPTHKKFPEINLGEIGNNTSVNYVFKKTGRYEYHDHYNPESSGTIIVE